MQDLGELVADLTRRGDLEAELARDAPSHGEEQYHYGAKHAYRAAADLVRHAMRPSITIAAETKAEPDLSSRVARALRWERFRP